MPTKYILRGGHSAPTPFTSGEIVEHFLKDTGANPGMIDKNRFTPKRYRVGLYTSNSGKMENPNNEPHGFEVLFTAFTKAMEGVVNNSTEHSSIVSKARR